MLLYFLVIFSALLNGVAQLLRKQSHIQFTSITHIFGNSVFIAGCVLYAISICIRILALQKIEVSKAYPILALSYVVVVIGGYYIGEHISRLRICGIIVILMGVVIVSRS